MYLRIKNESHLISFSYKQYYMINTMRSQSESQYKKPNVVQKRPVIYNHKLGDPLASGGHNSYHCLEGLAQALQCRFFGNSMQGRRGPSECGRHFCQSMAGDSPSWWLLVTSLFQMMLKDNSLNNFVPSLLSLFFLFYYFLTLSNLIEELWSSFDIHPIEILTLHYNFNFLFMTNETTF